MLEILKKLREAGEDTRVAFNTSNSASFCVENTPHKDAFHVYTGHKSRATGWNFTAKACDEAAILFATMANALREEETSAGLPDKVEITDYV